MLTGTIVSESLRGGAVLAVAGLRLERLQRIAVTPGPGQPAVWTLIHVCAPDDAAGALAEALSDALAETGGWYADFRVGDERVVVFAGRIFRYTDGDQAGRAEAVAYGRHVGVPERQLDWEQPDPA